MVSIASLTNVTAVLRRLNKILWKSGQAEQARPGQPDRLSTVFSLLLEHWGLAAVLSALAESEEVVNAKAHEAVKTALTIDRAYTVDWLSLAEVHEKPKDTDLFV